MMRTWTFAAAIFSLALASAVAVAANSGSEEDDVEAGTIGTGILGEITGLGSIHIGGVEIKLREGAVVQSSLGPTSAVFLEVGETVVLHASLSGTEIVADSLRKYHPLIGPVDAISEERIQILGQTLDISRVEATSFRVGDWVSVSGLWQGETVDVSHLSAVAPQETVAVSGSYTLATDGSQKLGPFVLDAPKLQNVSVGDHLQVIGRWNAESRKLTPSQISVGLFETGLGTVFVEGYMSMPDAQGTYFIYGSGIKFQADNAAMATPQERSLFCVSAKPPTQFDQVRSLGMEREGRIKLLESLIDEGGFPCMP